MSAAEKHMHSLRLRRMGIDTYQQAVIYMRKDCHVCRSEGFEAQTRLLVRNGTCEILATLNVVTSELLEPGEAGLSEAAWRLLGAKPGGVVTLAHAPPLESLRHVRAKIYGGRLGEAAMRDVMQDVVRGHYSDVDVAAFVTACAEDRLDADEIISLTRAMIAVGQRIEWDRPRIADKHCVGGLPGNRTTLLVVPIVAALGLAIPKTSSRAITSPSGTADTMETLAPVELDLAAMRRVVDREGGCIVWGGAVHLSPADDVLIGIERALDLDSEGQLVASVLSKKKAAGSTHVVIDMPVGATAKVRTPERAARLRALLEGTGRAIGLEMRVVMTDGTQPVGRGIGPALEARAVLAVLRGEAGAAPDLRERSLRLAAGVMELTTGAAPETARAQVRAALDDGRAWRKFQAICESQGGMREPPEARHRAEVVAPRCGTVRAIDNRMLARVAKLAGAPKAKAAGLELNVRIGDRIERDAPLFTLHAETPGELEYAMAYAQSRHDIVEVGEATA